MINRWFAVTIERSNRISVMLSSSLYEWFPLTWSHYTYPSSRAPFCAPTLQTWFHIFQYKRISWKGGWRLNEIKQGGIWNELCPSQASLTSAAFWRTFLAPPMYCTCTVYLRRSRFEKQGRKDLFYAVRVHRALTN